MALTSCVGPTRSSDPDPGFQGEILADGEVTTAEYERAVFATQDCVEAKGWRTGDLEVGLDGHTLSFAVIWPTASDPDREHELSDTAASAFEECASELLDQVEVAYMQSQRPVGRERFEMGQQLVACLQSAGIDGVPVGVTEAELVETIVAHERGLEDPPVDPWLCRERYITLFADP